MDRLEKALEKARRDRAAAGLSAGPFYDATARRITLPDVPVSDPAAEPSLVIEEQLEQHRIIARNLRNANADTFRMLRTKVLQIMNQTDYRTLAITSPNYGDGKTTIAINLALSLALDVKQTVLLVDLDFRKPNLPSYLGINAKIGLRDYLLHNTPLKDCIVRPSFDRISVLPAGKPLDFSSEMLGSPKMAALANELKTRYPDRMVIYDMPPVLAQDDSIAFLPHVDAVLMVVRDGVTKVEEVKQSLDALAKANVIGTVLNDNGV